MTANRFNNDFFPLKDSLYRLAYSLLGSADEAEDAVQDLFLKIWQTEGELSEIKSPKAYCLTLMKNLCLDRLKSKRYKDRRSIDGVDLEAPPEEGRLGERERVNELYKAIEHLPARERMVLKMKILDDLSYTQIEKQTGIPNLSLRVLVSNARKKLRKVYENN